MAKKITCTVCGKKYEYCHSCGNYDPYEAWRYAYCSENCRAFYNITNEYGHQNISKQEAYSLLKDLDFTNMENFHPAIQKYSKEIMEVQ